VHAALALRDLCTLCIEVIAQRRRHRDTRERVELVLESTDWDSHLDQRDLGGVAQCRV